MKRLLVIALVATALPARADRDFDRLLGDGARCYEQLNYGCAITKLGQAVARAQARGLTLDPEVGLQLFQTFAFALASVERHAEAADAFARCFRIRPTYSLDPAVISPRIYADFQTARTAWLQSLLAGGLRAPRLPSVEPPPPPRPSDLRLVLPSYAPVGAGDLPSTIDLLVGASLLFGSDAEKFDSGFGIGVRYGYDLLPNLQAEVLVQFYEHAYALSDAIPGNPTTLYVLTPGVGIRGVVPVGDWVELALGADVGASFAGIGSLSDTTGGFILASASLMVTPARGFAFGVTALPMLTLAKGGDDSLRSSFSLPILARSVLRF